MQADELFGEIELGQRWWKWIDLRDIAEVKTTRPVDELHMGGEDVPRITKSEAL